ncbi:hypothetical protein Drorol1_Dr00019600 [Drosera rotundifolia]
MALENDGLVCTADCGGCEWRRGRGLLSFPTGRSWFGLQGLGFPPAGNPSGWESTPFGLSARLPLIISFASCLLPCGLRNVMGVFGFWCGESFIVILMKSSLDVENDRLCPLRLRVFSC